MIRAHQIDSVEFPSIDDISSRQFFSDAFGRTFITFSPELRRNPWRRLALWGQGGEAVRSEAPLAVIRTTVFEATKRAVIAAGGTITVALFEYPGGRRLRFRAGQSQSQFSPLAESGCHPIACTVRTKQERRSGKNEAALSDRLP